MEFENSLDVVSYISARKSCRSFSSKNIEDGDLKAILSAGLNAASGGNLQPMSIIVERDKERSGELSKLCGGQAFIAQANVNLIFLLDWHKYSIYAKQKNAPFVCNKAYMHFLIGVEDVMCAAQTIETAAHIMGIGSCYVGTSNSCADELVRMYDLPKMTYPIVILSMGYSTVKQPPKADKMPYDMMIFDGKYKDFTDTEIFEGFERKYAGKKLELPKNEKYLNERLADLKSALLTSYSEQETEQIVRKAMDDGFVNETQRRFGLHYSADHMYSSGGDILDMLKAQELEPFDVLKNR